MQELFEAIKEKDQLYAEKTDLHDSLKKEQLARTSASKEKQAQLKIVAIEVRPMTRVNVLYPIFLLSSLQNCQQKELYAYISLP